MPLIEAKLVKKNYPDGTEALRGINLKIEKGEFVAIMGPSGSGKSTLLHILGFLDSLSDGEYFFKGVLSSEYSEDEMAKLRNTRIGFVFQMFNLLARTSVADNVKLPLQYSNVPESEWEERVNRAIESVGLSHRKEFEPSKLSGGEKQRVAIARALVNDPEIIFADEPTGNLDSRSSAVILETLSKLHAEGHTIILITHETFTAEYAERIVRLRDGKIESDERVKARRKNGEEFVK